MDNDISATFSNDYETIMQLIEGRELDKVQERKLTGLVNDIKELWLLAKMASGNNNGIKCKRQNR